MRYLMVLALFLFTPLLTKSQDCTPYIRNLNWKSLSELLEDRYNSLASEVNGQLMLYAYIETDDKATFVYTDFFTDSGKLKENPPTNLFRTDDGLLVPVYFGIEKDLGSNMGWDDCVKKLDADYFSDDLLVSLHTYPHCWKFKDERLVKSSIIKKGKNPIPEWTWAYN